QSETPLVAARREMREEIGLGLRKEALMELGWIAPEPGVIKARVRLFAAPNLRPSGRAAREPELGHGKLRFFNRSTVLGMIDRGAIEEPCTLVAIYRYLRMVHRGAG